MFLFGFCVALNIAKNWPCGNFKGKITTGFIEQYIAVETDTTIGRGRIKLRGFINADDNFTTTEEDTILFGHDLTQTFEKIQLEFTDVNLTQNGGIIRIRNPVLGHISVEMNKY